MTETGAPRTGVPPTVMVALAAIGALGSIAIHMFVPAMPAIAADLAASERETQLAVSAYLAGLGVGQLAGGPLADIGGRRPVALAAVALFMLGALGAGLARNADQLIAFRFVQALGGGGGLVTARAMLSDLAEDRELATKLATLTAIILFSPAVAPLVGGLVAAMAGWRAIFAFFVIGGAVIFFVTWLRVPESLPRASARRSGRVTDALWFLARGYGRILRHRIFWRATLAVAGGSAALYVFLGGSPFLLIERYGLTPAGAGLCYLSIAAAGIIGTRFVARFERRRGAFRQGMAIGAAGAALMCGLALAGVQTVAALIGPMLFLGFGAGLAAPAGAAAILQSAPGLSASASSLGGAIQMLASGAATALVTRVPSLTPLSIGASLLTLTLLAMALAPPSGMAGAPRQSPQ